LNFYEDKYICADSMGIYLYDEKFNNPEILYEWNKHGQTVEQIHEIYSFNDCCIKICGEE